MIYLDLEQGTKEWEEARLGIPTASKFDKLVTAAMKPSSQWGGYANQLLAEWWVGHPIEWQGDYQYAERGTGMEREARAYYEMKHDVEVINGGFCLRDDRLVGCSPDGLIGDLGGLEIKCPAIHTHIGYVVNPNDLVEKYRHQVQGCLHVTRRPYWDMLSYHPSLPAVEVRVHPDEAYQKILTTQLNILTAHIANAKEILAVHRREMATA